MPRAIQDLLSSGETTEIYIGGTADKNKVPTHGDGGIISFKNSADLIYPLTSVFSKINISDLLSLDHSNGHITYDDVNSRYTFNSDGLFKVRSSGAVELGNNVEIEFTFYLNGVQIGIASNPVFVGRGAGKPIAISAIDNMVLTTGDYLEVFAKISADGDLTIKASSLSFEKTMY